VYAGGASPLSLSWPETSRSKSSFRYKRVSRVLPGRICGERRLLVIDSELEPTSALMLFVVGLELATESGSEVLPKRKELSEGTRVRWGCGNDDDFVRSWASLAVHGHVVLASGFSWKASLYPGSEVHSGLHRQERICMGV